jgi:hypothetical protein
MGDQVDELERLRAWKESAVQVLNEWDLVFDALGRPGPLGGSKAASALTEVRRLRTAGEQLGTDAHGLAPLIVALDPRVAILNGYVAAYSYLDHDGAPSYGVRFGGEERTLGLLGLTVVAQQHLYRVNEEH